MIKKFLLVAIILPLSQQLFSQGHTANLDKYWKYRERLTSQFLVVGDEPGMSIPAGRRDTLSQTLLFGDATIWLGWYCGALALEYHLLTHPQYQGYDNGNSNAVDSTLNELYYALNSLKRLDERAESAFPAPCDSSSIRNGFFIRDDVPFDFFNHFPGIGSIVSDYTQPDVYAKEMSQDQAYHVLTGLALIKKFIPESVQVNGMTLHEEAVNQAILITEWMSRYRWMIKNPSCFVSGVPKNVARGADARFYSPGTNAMVKFISDNAVSYDTSIDSINYVIWATLSSPTNPAYSNIDNLHMAMTIAAVGKGWGTNTLTALMELASPNRWAVYPMLYVALHEDTSAPGFAAFRDTLNRWSEMMMDLAPPQGPYTDYPDTVSHGYAVINRFMRDWALQHIGNSWTQGSQFNGLDYMMLHNLYYVFNPSKWSHAINPVREPIELDNPSLKIFPNPGSSSVFVSVPLEHGKQIDLRIFNSAGEVIQQSHIINSQRLTEINVSDFPPGTYLLLATDEKGRQSSTVFVRTEKP